MNQSKFNDLLQFYKKYYKKIEVQERYKWEAVQHFQKVWDIECDHTTFPSMLEEALKKTKNLMSSGQYYPRRMIEWIAKKEPETTRNMFKELFDLNTDIKDRITNFRQNAELVIKRHKTGTISKHYQDDRAIMVYLNLRYPEKYYLYKYTMFKDFVELIDYDDTPKSGEIENIFKFESLCEFILNRVKSDKQLLDMYEERKKQFYDPEYHLLVQDIIYSAHYYNEPSDLIEDKNALVSRINFDLRAVKKSIILKGSHKDYIEEAKVNKRIGDAGEEFVFQQERAIVNTYNLPSTKKVKRVSVTEGDGLGYDILSYDKYGEEKYIEVKTTKGAIDSSLYISTNELEMSEQHSAQYWLYRVYEFDDLLLKGKIAERKGSLKDLCIAAQSYKVCFK